MNNLEFRVWCKENNEWEKDLCFLNQDGNLFHIGKSVSLIPLRKENHIIQFYIGREDRNNKKIFEGDYILCYDRFHKNEIYEVWYKYCSFFPFADPEDGVPYPSAKECSIIGNKFENTY